MRSKIYSIKIGGPAGMGVKSVGLMLAKLSSRSGYNIYNHIEYPSLIRGDHNVMQVNISEREVTAPRKITDLLIALNQDTLSKHFEELATGSGIIFDADSNFDTQKVSKGVILFPIPLAKIASEAGQKEQFINIVTLGAALGLNGGSFEILKALIDEEFRDKGSEVVACNLEASQKGYQYAIDNFQKYLSENLKPISSFSSPVQNMVINGNDAAALGAIAGGMEFSAIYPMSPISNIITLLALNQEKYGYIYKQPEDEISAVNMAIGASFAGKRSMTATSGGGFCLMTEGLGLAGMTETPLVIIEGMRPGPATSLPTWSEQGDLQFILHAHQGDFPRIVLAPGDAKETFELTRLAFNLADKYQTPVVILIDKNLCDQEQTFPYFDLEEYKVERGKSSVEPISNFQRYKNENDGISLRSFPGTGNYFITNSDEHNESGFSSEEIEDRVMMMQKRMRKLETCIKEDMSKLHKYGPEKADLTIVAWGNTKGSILEALKSLPGVNFIHLNWLSPFPAEELIKMLSTSKIVLDIECNFSGQLANVIREKTGIEIKEKLLKYDGRQIFPEEIIDKVKEILGR